MIDGKNTKYVKWFCKTAIIHGAHAEIVGQKKQTKNSS